MTIMNYDVVIIGGGPAGLACALSIKKQGIDSILILERDNKLGGILNQCIHNGFGLHTFKEELTGPEYAYRYIKQVEEANIEYKLDSMVIDVTKDKQITYVSKNDGLNIINAKAIVLAMGCRERSRGALNIPGFRPAGVYSAGAAQRLMNIDGLTVGKEVVILGSGDIGLIMARRMSLEGARVKCVAEVMPYSGGLKRNIVQCLNDFDIPLLLSHTVVDIKGKERVESVVIAKVDENRKPIKGTEVEYKCDTLLLSVGLLPENELSKLANVELSTITNGPIIYDNLETSVDGIFACGNVLHVHDLVDYVSNEADNAGKGVAKYLKQGNLRKDSIKIETKNGVRYSIPSYIDVEHMDDSLLVRFRVANVYKDKYVTITKNGEVLRKTKKKVLAPGEMEQFILLKKDIGDAKELVISLED